MKRKNIRGVTLCLFGWRVEIVSIYYIPVEICLTKYRKYSSIITKEFRFEL